jgi:subtilisin family serine protease
LPPSRRRGLTAAVAVVLAALTATGPAAADSVASPPAAAASPATALAGRTGVPRTVTLITGDKVTVTGTADGHTAATVRDPQGRPSGAHVMTVGADTYVYPDAALPYIASGAVDEQLFNVTGLLADGYDDARSDRLPLIVTYTDAAARSRSAKTPEGASRTLTLSSIQGAAISARHARAADFWSSLTGTGAAPAGTRAAGIEPSSGRLAGGIAKVWLDGKVKATLSDTTAQIGAPQVWQGGDTGQGVDVAVLDTGIDAAHPDFGGRIAATQSFVPGQDVTDRHGHGTHVASTVAGTGAASGGKEQGVAPGAALHIGKVLDNNGSGQDSWILAGMEWAARDQHAKVVSMSLGGGPTDGTDPLSQAVNRLSEETGALFVIAAGNSGPAPYSVSAPGAADAALTVGAVDAQDRLASFSSRGPRTGDSALKPDLTAPGVDVLAARSQYAPEGEGSYLTMSGTSMATPHVAGAAALLAAKHPDWTGQQLKDALVSTTKTTRQYSPYTGGSGRLDIAATVNDSLFATGSVFTRTHWPYTPGQTVRKDVTYTNTGAEPVTVDLAVNAPGVPEGLFTLTDSRLTVPAHGTATVGVVSHLDAAQDDAGYSAVLTATGTDGTLRTHTPIGVSKESRRVNLSFTAKDRRGGPLPGMVILKDVTRDTIPQVYSVDDSGSVSLSVRPSTYAAWMYAAVPGIDGTHSRGLAVLSAPEVVLDRDRTVCFDAGALRKAAAVAPQRTTNSYLRVDQYRSYKDLHPFFDSYQPEFWLYDSLWVTPTPKVTQGSYTFATRWREVQPPLTLSSGGRPYDDVVIQSLSPKLPEGTGTYAAVWAGDGSAADFARLAVRGKVAVVRRSDTVSAPDQAAAAKKSGARLLLILNDGYGPLDAWADLPEGAPLPVASLGTDDAARLLPRVKQHGATLKLVSHPYAHYLYDLVRHHDGAIPRDPSYRPGAGELARIDESFRDTKRGEAVAIRYDLSPDFAWAVGAAVTTVPAQGATTSWVTAKPGVKWVAQAAVPDLTELGSSHSYRPRSRNAETWFAPVHHPRLLGDSAIATAPSRVGNILAVFGMPAWGDSGGHAGIVFDGLATAQTSLYQGDELLSQGVDYVSAEVSSPEPRPYRLVVDGARDLPGRPYAIRTHTEWRFTSGYTDDTSLVPMALVQLDYAVPTDLSGRAHRRSEVKVTASQLPGALGAAPISAATLEVSYDDGKTWHRTSLRHKGGSWQGRLDAPAKARFATLRATARDAKGNSVSQTVVRAFGLK